MSAAHPYFRLMWDNAYAVHHFRGNRPQPLNIMDVCTASGNPGRPIMFTSLSKVSFAGASVSAMAASGDNLKLLRTRLGAQTVGPDKINQLRHVRFFKDLNGILAHMEKHAAIMRPKFELAEEILSARLGGTGAAQWTVPDGGYFISLDTCDNRATRTAALCGEAGLIITDAGATFPYKRDPSNRNLRIAPSYLSMNELETALEVLCAAIKLARNEENNPPKAKVYAGEYHA
jgi:DNA-binding transcriptional MocR family regulator